MRFAEPINVNEWVDRTGPVGQQRIDAVIAEHRNVADPKRMSAFHPLLPLAPVGSLRSTDGVRTMVRRSLLSFALAAWPEPSPAVRRLVASYAVDDRKRVRDARLLGHAIWIDGSSTRSTSQWQQWVESCHSAQ